ncbi:Nif3-like dinuclear metal center hexameric protein [Dictyobacter kobayashii]|uniref:GTP cyclohydrolase 1 type 2 homolog n=1 Tax=Dictyobacter kobayashii TaxID=2014872 RepID=A0A402ATP9_9CHLR|nr:Nif3-like dinuclear metal center hexameric protein [Dictyobacter kobayashii]GCE22490.1 hypothetical protein KDK_62900 [Dictyobacter kobayashii]
MRDPSLEAMALYLDSYLDTARFPDDEHGIYHAGKRTVGRIGLAIEPWPAIGQWVGEQELDALFLHRPWHINLHTLPPDVGVLAYHLAFDLSLTFGFNPPLAAALHMHNLLPCTFREGIAYGMLGDITPTPLKTLLAELATIFGHPAPITKKYTDIIQRIAVVGAMNDTSIRAAAAEGVQLYITGQLRQPARLAIEETKMTVAIIGHSTGEQWGLHALGNLLTAHWPQLEVYYP